MARLQLKMLLKAAVVGFVGSVVLGALAFALAPFFDAAGLYAAPARFLLPGTAQNARAEIFGSLLSGGGTPAGVFLILVVAILFWALVIGIVYLAWALLRDSRSRQPGAPDKTS